MFERMSRTHHTRSLAEFRHLQSDERTVRKKTELLPHHTLCRSVLWVMWMIIHISHRLSNTSSCCSSFSPSFLSSFTRKSVYNHNAANTLTKLPVHRAHCTENPCSHAKYGKCLNFGLEMLKTKSSADSGIRQHDSRKGTLQNKTSQIHVWCVLMTDTLWK